jgi:hypothetical protein
VKGQSGPPIAAPGRLLPDADSKAAHRLVSTPSGRMDKRRHEWRVGYDRRAFTGCAGDDPIPLPIRSARLYFAVTITGGFHVPSPGGKIDGGVAFGQYRRITR